MLKVTATQNSKLLYLTAQSFNKMFGELELAKLQQFMEKVDIEGIRKRILQSWQSKKRVNKQLKHFTEQGESK